MRSADAAVSGLPDLPELRQRRTTPDHIADSLRAAIYQGSLPDGAVLNQVAVAEHFGVSRVPVREAMRQLQAEGLISAQAHRRPTVCGLSLERILEIFDLRAIIEGYLAEKAVQQTSESTLSELSSLLEKMQSARDHAAWLELNARFHHALYEPSGAVTALQIAEQLRGRAERYLQIWSEGRGVHRSSEAAREHERILSYARTGDASAVRREVEQHVIHTRDEVVRLYRQRANQTDTDEGSHT